MTPSLLWLSARWAPRCVEYFFWLTPADRADATAVYSVDRLDGLFSAYAVSRPNSDRPCLRHVRVCVGARVPGVRAAFEFSLSTNHQFWHVPVAFAAHAGQAMLSMLQKIIHTGANIIAGLNVCIPLIGMPDKISRDQRIRRLHGIMPCSTSCVIGRLTISLTFKAARTQLTKVIREEQWISVIGCVIVALITSRIQNIGDCLIYLHSLFLSMAAWRGVASTIAFGGDSRKSIPPFVILSKLKMGIVFESDALPVWWPTKQEQHTEETPKSARWTDRKK